MRRLLIAGCALSFALGGVSLLSMSSCAEPELSPFGNPNTLDRKSLPGEGGVEALVCGAGEGGAGASDFDGGCPSFATDIFPYFTAGGTWRCADKSCHGGTSDPPIAETTPAACLESLKKITVAKIPYVLSDGGTNPNAQSLLCNLQGSCGSRMPKPPGEDPTIADLCKVEAWLKCGAPP